MLPSFIKKIASLLIVFLFISIIFLIFQQKLLSLKINTMVVLVANTLLFIVSIIGIMLQTKTINNKNANAAIRGVMGATILKLFILIITAVLYIYFKKENTNIRALIISMILYIVYTFIETRTALKINQQQSAGDRTSAS